MKTISDIIRKRDSELTKLVNKVAGSQNLEAIFHGALDANLAKNCSFANYKDSILTATVKNSSWGVRLRYAMPDIIKDLKIQPEFKDITNIRYAISASNKKAAKKRKGPAKMSKKNEKLWQKTMSELRKDKIAKDAGFPQ